MSAVLNLPSNTPTTLSDLGYASIKERMTPELIFAFVEPIGGGGSKVVSTLRSILETERFQYTINPIRISDFIKEEMTAAGEENATIDYSKLFVDKPDSISEEFKRICLLQRYGNILREKNGYDYLAKKAIQKISEYRGSAGVNGVEQANGGVPVAKPIRVAHIIKSLKNTDELALLKSVYGNMLILVATSGNYKENLETYIRSSTQATKIEFDALTTIDQDEGIDHGQQVRDVFYKADLFLNTKSAEDKLNNFLQVLFGQKILSPTSSERMMFEAFAARLRTY